VTHEELLDKVYWHWRKDPRGDGLQSLADYRRVILSIVYLHKPADSRGDTVCAICPTYNYPCPTIQAIEKELV